MARHQSKKYVNHTYEDSPFAIEYRLRDAPPKARAALKAGDKRSACVQMERREPLNRAALIQAIAGDHTRLANPSIVRYVLDILRETVLNSLRQGQSVSIEDFLSIQPSFVGRVDPQNPYEVKHLPLAASVRFSESFNCDLNRGVKIHYAPGLQPTRIEIQKILHLNCSHAISGIFHNTQTLKVDLIEGETVTPCKVELRKNRKSTRDYGKNLNVYHLGHDPVSPYALRFTWVTATGEETSEIHHL